MATQKELLLEKLSEGSQEYNWLILEVADTIGAKIESVRRRLNELVSERRVKYEAKKGKKYVVLLADDDPMGMVRENERLNQELTRLVRSRQVTSYQFDGETIRFGSIGDTQLGSRYENLALLNAAYDVFADEGIDLVLHPGDLLDGEKMYRGHEYELHTHGSDAQVAYCVKEYPYREGVETDFILGNHDRSFWKHSGTDIGLQIDRQREDMVYLGMGEADVTLSCDVGDVVVRLSHPGKGTSYAISYQVQKYVEALTGGHKPNMLLVGHYHKQEHIFYRNIQTCQTGCAQHQTPFMRERNLAAMQGFYIIELTVNEMGISRCKTEWMPCYD